MKTRMVCLLIAATTTGCGGEMSDLHSYISEVKARKSANIEPIPEIRPYEAFAYRTANRREPFTPAETNREQERKNINSGIRPDADRRAEPLEDFPLDAMRMAGTLSIAGTRYALLTAPDGVVHRTQVGNHIGQNYGEIVAINDAEVRLIEIVPDGLGGYLKRPATVALSQ